MSYLESPRVVFNNQDGVDFTSAILVFTTMTQEVVLSESAMSPESSLSYKVLCQEYKMAMDQYTEAKAQRRQGNLDNKR